MTQRCKHTTELLTILMAMAAVATPMLLDRWLYVAGHKLSSRSAQLAVTWLHLSICSDVLTAVPQSRSHVSGTEQLSNGGTVNQC